MNIKGFAAAALCAAALVACGAEVPQASAAGSGYKVGDRLARPAVPAPPARDDYREISWDDLMPADWDPMALLDKLDKLDMNSMEDADPRAMEALAAIRKAWDEAPVVPALMSQRIRIPGFLVRLEGDQEGITEFLLVPYFGACVHVPPPPSNQVIHVVAAKPVPADQNMQAVWVSGVMSVAAAATDMGNAGYRIEAQKVAPYAEELPAR